jgi:hypothetical protein
LLQKVTPCREIFLPRAEAVSGGLKKGTGIFSSAGMDSGVKNTINKTKIRKKTGNTLCEIFIFALLRFVVLKDFLICEVYRLFDRILRI